VRGPAYGRRDRRGGEQGAEPLRQAYEQGKLTEQRLSDMVRRILRSMFAVGIDRWEGEPEVDLAARATRSRSRRPDKASCC
jgi:hypothetical protein